MNLVLIGFMGVGKTSVGRRLAHVLGRPFIDTDALIEEARSMTVMEIFERYGEGSFRETEKEVIASLSKYDRCVIATGGGTVIDPLNVLRLKERGFLIHLYLPLSIIWERLAHETGRPLLLKENRAYALEELFKAREALYHACRDLKVDRSSLGVEATAEKILEILGSFLQEE